MNTGIYTIEHKASGKKYIGSAISFSDRWNAHRHYLRRGTHHSAYLQAAWNKHGEGSFSFRKLVVCATKDLLFYEQLCINAYKSADGKSGYNMNPSAGSQLGYKHTEKTLEKMRAKRALQKHSAETRSKISTTLLGRSPSPETRAKISASNKARWARRKSSHTTTKET